MHSKNVLGISNNEVKCHADTGCLRLNGRGPPQPHRREGSHLCLKAKQSSSRRMSALKEPASDTRHFLFPGEKWMGPVPQLCVRL